MSKITIYEDNTISVGTTITGYYVCQESNGTKVRRWYNNGYPPPRDLGVEIGGEVKMPRERYTLSTEAGRALFEADFLEIWNTRRMLMNPHTGSVDTEENWRADARDNGWSFDDATLIEVLKDGRGGWQEVSEPPRTSRLSREDLIEAMTSLGYVISPVMGGRSEAVYHDTFPVPYNYLHAWKLHDRITTWETGEPVTQHGKFLICEFDNPELIIDVNTREIVNWQNERTPLDPLPTPSPCTRHIHSLKLYTP
jgi:hypothetical protein